MIRAIQSGAALLSKFFEDPKQVLQGTGFKKTYLRHQKIFKGSKNNKSVFLRWCSVLALCSL